MMRGMRNVIKGRVTNDLYSAILAVENWKTSVNRYLAYCKSQGIVPKDITSFTG